MTKRSGKNLQGLLWTALPVVLGVVFVCWCLSLQMASTCAKSTRVQMITSPNLIVQHDVGQQGAGKDTLLFHAQVLDYSKVYSAVYLPANFSTCLQAAGLVGIRAPQCWLRLQTKVNCQQLFKDYLGLLTSHVPVFPSPSTLPEQRKQDFLLNGFTQLSSYYIAQPDYAPGAAVPVWDAAYVNSLVKQAEARASPFGNYGGSVGHIYQALDCHPVKGQTGAVFGSEHPWVEAVLFAFGKHTHCTSGLTPYQGPCVLTEYLAWQCLTKGPLGARVNLLDIFTLAAGVCWLDTAMTC